MLSMTTSEHDRIRGPLPEHVDVAIVGSGLGALVAGANLARRGLKVALFEAHSVAGGCATQFARGPRAARYHFDVGLHYIGDCGPEGAIPRILRNVGLHLDYAALDPDGFDTLVFPDLQFRIPSDIEVYRDRLVATFPHERRGIDRYIRLLKQVMRVGQRFDKKDGRFGLTDMVALAFDAYGIGRNRNRTIGEVLDDYAVRDPRLRAVLLGQSGDYGLPPSKASAFLHLGLAGHYFRGAYYPKGGGQIIADKLAAEIERSGGSVHLGRPVAEIVITGGRATGVKLEPKAGSPARMVSARVVLSNADLRVTFEKLIGLSHLPASWVSRVPLFEMPAALFMTFLGVKADIAKFGMRATNYWQFDSYDMEGFYSDDQCDARRGAPIRSRGCYVTSATLKDPESAAHHAPPGVANVEVMTIVPGASSRWHVSSDDCTSFSYKDNAPYREQKALLEDEMVNRLEGLFPGTREAIVYRESATPVSHIRYTRATDGTGYGLAATPGQFLKNRPGYRGPLDGLYLCGASTRAGHGIVGAMVSGERAAKRILRDLERPAT
jgi:all-trans-retinol 13,14-reductase